MASVRTPSARSTRIAASPIGFFGSRVTYQLSSPNCARLTATFASPPPKVATSDERLQQALEPGRAQAQHDFSEGHNLCVAIMPSGLALRAAATLATIRRAFSVITS